jgi:hypothetical protein
MVATRYSLPSHFNARLTKRRKGRIDNGSMAP